ncbi:hypothetical protein EON65_18745 [archaeon]|nr:MAG: hypothetical protein EON65_18745 [archaeon]
MSQSCFICASAINSVDNFITYMFWITHRENWQDVGKVRVLCVCLPMCCCIVYATFAWHL